MLIAASISSNLPNAHEEYICSEPDIALRSISARPEGSSTQEDFNVRSTDKTVSESNSQDLLNLLAPQHSPIISSVSEAELRFTRAKKDTPNSNTTLHKDPAAPILNNGEASTPTKSLNLILPEISTILFTSTKQPVTSVTSLPVKPSILHDKSLSTDQMIITELAPPAIPPTLVITDSNTISKDLPSNFPERVSPDDRADEVGMDVEHVDRTVPADVEFSLHPASSEMEIDKSPSDGKIPVTGTHDCTPSQPEGEEQTSSTEHAEPTSIAQMEENAPDSRSACSQNTISSTAVIGEDIPDDGDHGTKAETHLESYLVSGDERILSSELDEDLMEKQIEHSTPDFITELSTNTGFTVCGNPSNDGTPIVTDKLLFGISL